MKRRDGVTNGDVVDADAMYRVPTGGGNKKGSQKRAFEVPSRFELL